MGDERAEEDHGQHRGPGGPGFLPRHDEDLREPLVRRQGSQVSVRVARGSASWLSSAIQRKRLVHTSASDAHPCPQIARKLVNLS